jgi:hypothetical protein
MRFRIEACDGEEYQQYQQHRVIEVDADDSLEAEGKALQELGSEFYAVETSRKFEDLPDGWTPVFRLGCERRHTAFDTLPTFAAARRVESEELLRIVSKPD